MEHEEHEGLEEGLSVPGLVLLKNCGEHHDSVFTGIKSLNTGPLPFFGPVTAF